MSLERIIVLNKNIVFKCTRPFRPTTLLNRHGVLIPFLNSFNRNFYPVVLRLCLYAKLHELSSSGYEHLIYNIFLDISGCNAVDMPQNYYLQTRIGTLSIFPIVFSIMRPR
jgi:hypothetical protein